MSRRMRWLLAVVFGYAAFAAVYLSIYRRMYVADASCDQPCQDLGNELAAQFDGPVKKMIYKPKCEPLSLKLELLEPKVRASWKTPLWYRVTMKNKSCQMLSRFHGGAFLDGNPTSPPAGYDIARDTDVFGGGIWTEFAADGAYWNERDAAQVKHTPIERIIPYLGDPEASERMDREFDMDDYYGFDLLPGQQVKTASPKLLPRKWLPGIEHGLNSGIPAMAEIARKALYPDNPGYQTPPAGGYLYRFLLHPRKGRFRIVIQKGALSAYRIPRYSDSQLRWASYPLFPVKAIEFLFDVELIPTRSGRASYYRVTAASNWVDFEATP